MTRMTRSLVAPWTALALLVGAASHVSAQIVPESTPMATWGVNGEVRALARVGRTLYVGGTFDIVGPPSGGLAIVDGTNAGAITPSADVASANRVAPDGAGGWYVAQWYTSALDIAVLHIRADGTRDPAWTPARFEPGTSIYGLVAGGGRVYVSGSLGVVNGVRRPGAVALDATTGAVLPWALTTRGGQPVYEAPMMASAAGRIYFSILSPAADIVAIDASSGTLLPFQAVSAPVVASVSQLAATATRLFAIGDGCGPNGVGLGLCAFDAQSGALVWRRGGAEQIWSGATRVYVATRFLQPEKLEALDGDTGAATGWSVLDTGYVADVSEANGRTYVIATRNQSRTYPWAFDAATANELDWHPLLPDALSITTQGTEVAVGGQFRLAGGVRRRHLVALDLDTGRPAAVQPAEPFGAVNALATYGDAVFAAMESGAPEIFAFAAPTGVRYPWAIVPNGKPLSLLVSANTLYIGGFFSQLSGEDRGFLGAVDLPSGVLLPWNPLLDFEVSELTGTATRVYAAGRSVGGIGTVARSAAFDAVTRARQTFEAPVYYQYGSGFLGAAGRRLLAVARYWFSPQGMGASWIDPDDGHLLENIPLDFASTRARGAGDTIVVGGLQRGARLRAIHAATGAVLAWSPDIAESTTGSGLYSGITALHVGSDLVAAGGLFEVIGGRQVANLAVFRASAAAPAAPRALTAGVSGFSATVSWLSDGAADTFLVEAGSSSGTTDVGIFPVGTATSATGALGAGRYFVRVKSVGDAGVSPASSEVILDVPSTSVAPEAPGGLSGTVTAGVVTLRWRAAAGNAASYVIEAGSGPGLANLAVLATGHLDTTFVTAAPPGTYHVRVRATNAFGQSGASNEIVVVVP